MKNSVRDVMRLFLTLLLIVLVTNLSYCQPRILLDNFYNNEFDMKTGKSYHYLWDDFEVSGFSELGKLFIDRGCVLSLLKEKPNQMNLKGSAVYIIVDTDTKMETESPNFMDVKSANEIATWVKKGGVLMIMANDKDNCELDSLNLLAKKFGIKFNKDVLHSESPVPKDQPRNFGSCASEILPNHQLFNNVHKIFIKGIASMNCEKPSHAFLIEHGKTLMAESSYGKGKVIAIGDPWLYNEYIDHWSLPDEFDNYQAAKNLVSILLNIK